MNGLGAVEGESVGGSQHSRITPSSLGQQKGPASAAHCAFSEHNVLSTELLETSGVGSGVGGGVGCDVGLVVGTSAIPARSH